MKKPLSDKGTSFDMTKVREEESDSKNVKRQDVHGKQQKMDEKPRFEQEWNALALLSFVLCGEKR